MPVERETGIEYEIVYSKRKTIGVKVDRDGKVFVYSPPFVALPEIDAINRKHESFILKHRERMTEKSAERQSFNINKGSKLLFLGREYEVKHHDKNCFSFDGESFFMPQNVQDCDVIKSFVSLYKVLAKRYIPEYVAELSPIVGVYPMSVRINSAVTRWGSCSGRGVISYNWRLILMPDTILDYVVVHELCHLIEMNHSKAFWNLVGTVLPDYQKRRAWLKENGMLYS